MKLTNILGVSFIAFIILGCVLGTAVQFATHYLPGIVVFTLGWGIVAGVLLRELMIRLDASTSKIRLAAQNSPANSSDAPRIRVRG